MHLTQPHCASRSFPGRARRSKETGSPGGGGRGYRCLRFPGHSPRGRAHGCTSAARGRAPPVRGRGAGACEWCGWQGPACRGSTQRQRGLGLGGSAASLDLDGPVLQLHLGLQGGLQGVSRLQEGRGLSIKGPRPCPVTDMCGFQAQGRTHTWAGGPGLTGPGTPRSLCGASTLPPAAHPLNPPASAPASHHHQHEVPFPPCFSPGAPSKWSAYSHI